MAKFPIEMNDDEGQSDAINYLLSGPGGLGQNFSGFSAYAWPDRVVDGFPVPVPYGYITGNYRAPYSQPTTAQINISPISCSSAEQINDTTFKYIFSTPQATPPFALGNNLRGRGWTNGFYNGYQGVIGVVECTTTYVAFRTSTGYPGVGDDFTGGTVYVDNLETPLSTDCNARCTVTGGTDRVFISGQLDNLVSYEIIGSGSGNIQYDVAINRYKGFANSDPTNPDYSFEYEDTVALKQYHFTGLTVDGTLPLVETVFTSILDQPKPGYYWYIMEVTFLNPDGDIQPTVCQTGLRSITVQVVKQ
jgi:hypothetical protein